MDLMDTNLVGWADFLAPVVMGADSPALGIRMALDLNAADLTRQVAGYGFGSYAYVDDMICFTGFLPNPLRSPGLLPSVYFSCATRAHSMAITTAPRGTTLPTASRFTRRRPGC